MVRFAHISDTHLGYRQFNLDEREKDFYESFNEAIEKIIEERVDFVIHSGDLFETNRPQPRAILTAQKAIKKLSDKGIPIYAVPGNHDIILRKETMPPQVLFEIFNFKLFGGSKQYDVINNEIFIGGVPFYPHFYKKVLKERIENLSKIAENYKKRIIIIHEGLYQLLPFEGAYELSLEDLPQNFDYYAFGHIHRRVIRKFGRGILAYPGSIDVWRLDEVYDYKKQGKGFYIVDMDGDLPEIRKVDLESVRPFEDVEINANRFDEDLESVKSTAIDLNSNNAKKPIIYVRLKGKRKMPLGFYINRINQELSKYTLTHRLKFEFEEEEKLRIETKSLNLYNLILKAVNNDRSKADLAHSLYLELKDNNTNKAIEIAEKFFGRMWKK